LAERLRVSHAVSEEPKVVSVVRFELPSAARVRIGRTTVVAEPERAIALLGPTGRRRVESADSALHALGPLGSSLFGTALLAFADGHPFVADAPFRTEAADAADAKLILKRVPADERDESGLETHGPSVDRARRIGGCWVQGAARSADHPDASGVREQLWDQRERSLSGYRGVLGMAYLALVAD